MKTKKIILENKFETLLTLLVVLFSFVLIIASCKKKEEAPAPEPLPTTSVSFYWKGTAVSELVPGSSTLSGDYSQYGQNLSSGEGIAITYTIIPRVDTSYNLAASNIVSVVYYDANGDTWNAIDGTLTASLDRRYLTSRFSGATFHNQTHTVADVTSDSCSITTP
jgi:hypothetical protein